MSDILGYSPGESAFHKLNPLTKLVTSAELCAACFLTQSHLLIAGVVLLNLCLAASAGGARRSLETLLSFAKFSAFLFLLQVFFVRSGNVVLSLPFDVYVTDEGVSFSLLFVLRFMAATMPLALTLSATPVSDISNALVLYLRIPYKYAFALTTAIRFIPLFSEEMAAIMEAQTARGVQFDTKNFFKKIKLLLPLCVPLLISSVRKIESSAISAELRGFNLRTRLSGYKEYRFSVKDAAAAAICALPAALAFVI
ncbi:MAG: energy-coupling factor transporter transmembrane protein EcfT [Synergistaceae bacterium]|nr:energy-coupling factor transporter transmembrane protein EcfT [Synergistaceae bacterium]